jgi:uncharacterized protein YoxC
MANAEDIRRIVNECVAPLQALVTKVSSQQEALNAKVEKVEGAVKNISQKQDELKAKVEKVEADVKNISAKVEKVEGAVKNISQKQDELNAKVEKVEADVKNISQKQDDMMARENGRRSVAFTQHQNRLLGANQQLYRLRYTINGAPLSQDVEQPRTWAHLAIGGKENVPNGSRQDNETQNKWTREKSKTFLKAVLGADNDEMSDSEDSRHARVQRTAVAEVLGVPSSSLQALRDLS